LLEALPELYPEFAGLAEHYTLGRRLGQLLNGKQAWYKNIGADGRIHGGLRVLTIIDTFSRFSPAIEPRFNFRGADVVEVLERVGREVGLPAVIRVDQGSEFVSRDLDLWA
jgi:transposase InsO family protein